MPEPLLPVERIMTLLAGAPLRIASLTADKSPAQLHTPPEPGEWSGTPPLLQVFPQPAAAGLFYLNPQLQVILDEQAGQNG
jgi:hypothetical protein